MVDEFIRAKTTRRISYPHPLLEEILKETYGVVIYQEQVMQIAEKLANFSLAQADMLRKAMSKKIKEKMQELQEAFITGATKHSKLSEAQAKEIFFLLAKFAEYGFNKSHSAAYALIAYQTAYLKANYKLEFLCSLLSSEMQDQEKLNFYITECDRLKIIVIPPDINKSYFSFNIVDNNRLRFGLGGIKNVGYSAISKIVENRKLMGEYRSLFDFCQRQDLRVVNKKTIESLIKCGAFDSIVKNRAQLLSALEHTIELASKLKKSKDSYQLGLFEEDASWLIKKEDIKLPDLPEFPQDVIERFELEYLGVYLSKRQEELNKALHISIFADIYGDELYKLKTVLQNHPGYSQVYLHIFSKENKNKKEKIIKLPDTFLVSIDDELLHKLEILLKDVKLEVVTI
jgi:DNA polymerase-3 subunit alpha